MIRDGDTFVRQEIPVYFEDNAEFFYAESLKEQEFERVYE